MCQIQNMSIKNNIKIELIIQKIQQKHVCPFA